MKKYLVITEWKRGDANILHETNDINDARNVARTISRTDPDDAQTIIVLSSEWETGNYDTINY